MITINYYASLCASRHDILDPLGNKIKESVFPEICALNVKWLEKIAKDYVLTLSKSVNNVELKAVLNVYVTGFSPALVALINAYHKYARPDAIFELILYHYDNATKAYIPQVIL